MRPVELLATLTGSGCRVLGCGDRLCVSGPSSVRLTPQLRAAITEQKSELLKLLAEDEYEVRWRADAMRPQIPATGPIPFLVARFGQGTGASSCLSCGDPLTPGNRYRCGPCVKAAWLVLNAVREAV